MPKPKTEAAYYKPLNLRIPENILRLLQRQARAIGRPLNTHVILVLKHGLATETKSLAAYGVEAEEVSCIPTSSEEHS